MQLVSMAAVAALGPSGVLPDKPSHSLTSLEIVAVTTVNQLKNCIALLCD